MSNPDSTSSSTKWEEIESRPAFRSLLSAKARFLTIATVFFIAYYFALLVLVGWFPELSKKEIIGRVNVGYLFALSQFFMAWAVALLYMKKAAQWDKAAAEIIQGH